jgi:hypothetical protein
VRLMNSIITIGSGGAGDDDVAANEHVHLVRF